MPKIQKRVLLCLIIVVLVAGLICAGGCNGREDAGPAKTGEQTGTPAHTDSLPGIGPDAVADVVSQAGPATVKIAVKKSSGQAMDPFFNDPFFRQFFDLPFSSRQMEEGFGSGFIISPDGFILTNEHVIDGASEIGVYVAGFEQPYTAKVIGVDYDLDLALLQITAETDLPFLTLGNSDQIRVGNWVIAIGNPYGLDHTVTTGVISAKGRPVTVGDRQYENLLQTDASINPGNSGGPLLNLRGEVIGINTAINATAQGIGFAIPTSTVQHVLEDLKNSDQSVRPWIGVQVRTVDQEAARFLGLARAEGALVTGVVANSPAREAGLRQWDVIVEFNGGKISNADELVAAIKNTQVGQKVKVLVVRGRQLHSTEVTVTAKPVGQ